MSQVTVDVQDLISALKGQRNAALDAAAMCQARIAGLEKENAELQKKLDDKKVD